MENVISKVGSADRPVTQEQVSEVVSTACPQEVFRNQRVLLVIPDGTRTAPIGMMFQAIHDQLGEVTKALDIIVALGTHQPMSEEAICGRLEITSAERREKYGRVQFINHEWDNPEALTSLGTIPAEDIDRLSEGKFSMDIDVEINKKIFDYDHLIVVGPVFPHEVVGFSGGNKYFFPGIAGPKVLNFFHWLGAVVTTPMIIGNKWTTVRKVVDRAGAMIDKPKHCFCLVVDPSKELVGLHAGSPESAWDAASEQSRTVHITYKEKPFHTVVACLPEMYDELWTGGKGMYKLEPVVADGGELIIYGPHIEEICFTHGKVLREIGYHCRDYFLKQWDKFKNYPWGVLAHSAHVHGLGTFENGVETPRIKVSLATGIPPELCQKVNLGYRDPASISIEDYANREDEGVLLVRRAGEMLFQLKNPPAWAKAS